MVKMEFEDYLSPDDVGERSMVTFIDDGAYFDWQAPGETESKRIFKIQVRLPSGDEKSWTPNITSQRTIGDKFGKDSASWKGQSWQLVTVQQSIGGQMRKVIYAAQPPK